MNWNNDRQTYALKGLKLFCYNLIIAPKYTNSLIRMNDFPDREACDISSHQSHRITLQILALRYITHRTAAWLYELCRRCYCACLLDISVSLCFIWEWTLMDWMVTVVQFTGIYTWQQVTVSVAWRPLVLYCYQYIQHQRLGHKCQQYHSVLIFLPVYREFVSSILSLPE
jgi:hypothetical protein